MRNLNQAYELRILYGLLPAYALGATDPHESRFVEARLARFPAAAALTEDYALIARALYTLRPEGALRTDFSQRHDAHRHNTMLRLDTSPPPSLHDRIMAAARRDL